MNNYNKIWLGRQRKSVRTYVRTDSAGRGKWKRIPPLSPREGCPLLFQKALEMVDKSESDN